MDFEFRLLSVPDRHDSYHLAAFTEGTLSIAIQTECAWKSNDMLLIEFAATLRKWLARVELKGPLSLHYTSMNYEEDPVLAFVWHAPSGTYAVASELADVEIANIRHDDLLSACQRFLNELAAALAARCSISLDEVLSRAE